MKLLKPPPSRHLQPYRCKYTNYRLSDLPACNPDLDQTLLQKFASKPSYEIQPPTGQKIAKQVRGVCEGSPFHELKIPRYCSELKVVMAKKSRLEKLTDLIIASEKPPAPGQKAATTDPMSELGLTIGLGSMRVQLTRIQREIKRLKVKPTDELNEVEVQRLDAYYAVLSDPNLNKSGRFGYLSVHPIFNDIINTGESL